MSEHLRRNEQAATPEYNVEALPSRKNQAEKPRDTSEEAAERSDSLEAIRHHIEQEAISKDKNSKNHSEQTSSHPTMTGSIDPAHATMTRNRLLKHIRAHLTAPDRTLSKVIHHPAIDQLSELGGKTIARPSGLLGGGICAFLGSILFLYISKQYGYQYNFLLFIMFFCGGLIIGLLIEGLARLWSRFKV